MKMVLVLSAPDLFVVDEEKKRQGKKIEVKRPLMGKIIDCTAIGALPFQQFNNQ